MAVARHPVARIAPPAPAIISASRARVGERNGERDALPMRSRAAAGSRRPGSSPPAPPAMPSPIAPPPPAGFVGPHRQGIKTAIAPAQNFRANTRRRHALPLRSRAAAGSRRPGSSPPVLPAMPSPIAPPPPAGFVGRHRQGIKTAIAPAQNFRANTRRRHALPLRSRAAAGSRRPGSSPPAPPAMPSPIAPPPPAGFCRPPSPRDKDRDRASPKFQSEHTPQSCRTR